jgi:uncharacterized protein YjiS (DUF1127 family)
MPQTRSPRLRASSDWQLGESAEREHPEPAPRLEISYRCPQGHEFVVPFSAATDVDVEIPDVWECRRHSVPAQRTDIMETRPARTIPARTHWVMLCERRSIADLEALLDERLADLARCRRKRVRPVPAPTGSKGITAP